MGRHEAEQFLLPGVIGPSTEGRAPAAPSPGFEDRVEHSLDSAWRLLNGEPQLDFESFAVLRHLGAEIGRRARPRLRDGLGYVAAGALALARGRRPEPFSRYHARARFEEALGALRARIDTLRHSLAGVALVSRPADELPLDLPPCPVPARPAPEADFASLAPSRRGSLAAAGTTARRSRAR